MAMHNAAVGLCVWEQAAAIGAGDSLPQDGEAGMETCAQPQTTQDAFLVSHPQ